MKKKQNFQKFLNSVIKSHGYIEEDEREIENNMKKLFELLENNSGNGPDRSDFVSLLNDIKSRCHDLYGRHDGLIGKIKNKVHLKKGNSSSGSSVSGSEDSSDEDEPNSIHKQKAKKKLSVEGHRPMIDQIESLKSSNAEFEAQSTLNEKLDEIQHLAGELVAKEAVIMKLEDELRTMGNSLRLLDDENELFKVKREKLNDEKIKMNLLLSSLQEENKVLISEKEKAARVLLQKNNTMLELEVELEKVMEDARKVREDNSFLLSENERILIENQSIEDQNKASMQQVSDQNVLLMMMSRENDALKSEVLKLSTQMNNTDKTIKDITEKSRVLNDDILKLQEALEATEYERNSLIEEKTAFLIKMSEGDLSIDGLKDQIECIESEKSHLQKKISDLEHEIRSANLQFFDMKNSSMAAAEEIKALVSENLIVKNKSELVKERLQTELGELNQKNSILLSKSEEAEKNMLIESSLLKDDISNLHDIITDLKHQLKDKDDQIYIMELKSLEYRKMIQQGEERNINLSTEAERLKNENSILLAGRDNLKIELEGNNLELFKLKQVLGTTEFEKNSLREERTLLCSRHEDLKLELDAIRMEHSELQQGLEAIQFEKESLTDEKSAYLNRLSDGEIVIKGLKAQIDEFESERSQLVLNISSLNFELQSVNLQFSGVKNALLATEKEKKALVTEKSKLEGEIEEAEKNISMLNNVMTDFHHQLKVKDGENYEISMELSKSQKAIQQAEETNIILSVETESFKSKNSMILAELDNLKLELEAINQELLNYKQVMEIKESEINSLVEEKSLLSSEHENLKHALTTNSLELAKLKPILEALDLERNTLIDEKSFCLTKINDVEMIIDGLKAQIKDAESEKSQLQLRNNNLEFEIQSANHQFTDINNSIMAVEEEKKAVETEKNMIESKLHEAELMKERLRTELEELNQKNCMLLSKIEETQKNMIELGLLKEVISKLHDKISDISHQLKIKEDENYAMTLGSSESKRAIQQSEERSIILSSEGERMKSENSMLLAQHKSLKLEIESYSQELTNLKQALKASEVDRNSLIEKNSFSLGRINDLIAQIELVESQKYQFQLKISDLNLEIQSLNLQFSDLKVALVAAEEEKRALVLEKSEVDSKLYETEYMNESLQTELGELNKKIASLMSMIEGVEKCADDLKLERDGLIIDNVRLETKVKEIFLELEEKNVIIQQNQKGLQNKVEQMEKKEEIIRILERICSEQKNDINKWSKNGRELLEKLSFTEVGKLDAEKEVQRLEVQLRLSNQKIKVTETEFKEKEESGKRLVAGLQDELKLLDRHLLMCLRKAAELNNECKKVEAMLEISMNTLVNELHKAESASLLTMGQIKKQLVECNAELQSLKMTIKAELHEKRKLKKENYSLSIALTYREETILNMKDQARQKLPHLSENDRELRVFESRITELENNLIEKEKEVQGKDEEKREAIRQLCLVIEHHWENRNHLSRYLSSVLGSSRTT